LSGLAEGKPPPNQLVPRKGSPVPFREELPCLSLFCIVVLAGLNLRSPAKPSLLHQLSISEPVEQIGFLFESRDADGGLDAGSDQQLRGIELRPSPEARITARRGVNVFRHVEDVPVEKTGSFLSPERIQRAAPLGLAVSKKLQQSACNWLWQ
jgi:hypothetical protein